MVGNIKLIYRLAILFLMMSTTVHAADLSATDQLRKAKHEFSQAKANNPTYRQEFYDINYNIRYGKDFENNRHTLSVDKAWQGVMKKAWDPAKYVPQAIVRGMVLKDSIKQDDNAAYFVRLSVQHPFAPKPGETKYAVVREEVSIDKMNKVVYFMGRLPKSSDYQLLKIDPKDAAPQPIFLVEQKIAAIDNEPIDVWTLVPLAINGFNYEDQQRLIDDLGKAAKKPTSIYLQTQK